MICCIYINLSEEEKLVYSQLGINPLIKLGKEFIRVNNIPKLENNGSKKKELILSNYKEETVIKNSESTLQDNISKDVSDRDEIDNSNEQKVFNHNILKENQDNEDPEIIRRTRRRSSAGNE